MKPGEGEEVEALIDEFELDEEKGEYRMKVVFRSGDVNPGDTVEVITPEVTEGVFLKFCPE